MADTTPAPETDAPPTPAAPETPPPAPSNGVDDRLPDDHPLVRTYAKVKQERTELRERLQEYEDRDKTPGERLSERATAAEKRAEAAEQRALRLEVAAAKGLNAAQAKRLVGKTLEELEKDADEILEAFRPPEPEEPGRPKRRPSELTPGAVPGAEQEPDYDAIAERTRRW